MQVDGSGLDVVMSYVIFDMGDGFSPTKHIHSPRVSKAVNRINKLKALGRHGPCEVFFADSIDAMACQFFPALIDKGTVPWKKGHLEFYLPALLCLKAIVCFARISIR